MALKQLLTVIFTRLNIKCFHPATKGLMLLMLVPLFAASQKPPQINHAFNRFLYRDVNAFYEKLYQLETGKDSLVSIVHIGDSHCQAGFFPGVVRKALQYKFGNAGAGVVFPYQVAKTNGPIGVSSSSNLAWTVSRVTNATPVNEPGISGYAIATTAQKGYIQINTTECADSIRLFTSDTSNTTWSVVHDTSNNTMLSINNKDTNTIFYGAFMQCNRPGVLYNNIGVNGASYLNYQKQDLFWQQLAVVRATLFIITLGTNDAQTSNPDVAALNANIDGFVQKLKAAHPAATIILATAPFSYRRGRPNKSVRVVNELIHSYARSAQIPVWDLFAVLNGFASAAQWLRTGYMKPDRVHFSKEGYELQGKLLADMLLKGYNDYKATKTAGK